MYVDECFCIGVIKVCCEIEGMHDGRETFVSMFQCALDACERLISEAGLCWSRVLQLQVYVCDRCLATSLDQSVCIAALHEKVSAQGDNVNGKMPAVSLVSVSKFAGQETGTTVMQVYVRAYNIEIQQKVSEERRCEDKH